MLQKIEVKTLFFVVATSVVSFFVGGFESFGDFNVWLFKSGSLWFWLVLGLLFFGVIFFGFFKDILLGRGLSYLAFVVAVVVSDDFSSWFFVFSSQVKRFLFEGVVGDSKILSIYIFYFGLYFLIWRAFKVSSVIPGGIVFVILAVSVFTVHQVGCKYGAC